MIAESELKRAQLIGEWQTMAGEVHALTKQAKTASYFASVAASVVAGMAFFRQKKSAPTMEKSSRWHNLVKVAGLFSTFWSASRFRPKT